MSGETGIEAATRRDWPQAVPAHMGLTWNEAPYRMPPERVRTRPDRRPVTLRKPADMNAPKRDM